MTREQMEFPKTWEEYEKDYGFNDYKEVYTNNSRLIPSFRVKQWLDHLEQEPCEDCISRQAVLNTLFYKSDNNCEVVLNKELQDRIKALPHVTPTQRWIPVSERLPEIEEKDCHGNITFSKTVLTSQKYGNGFIHIGKDQYTTNNGGGWLSEVPFDDPDECCEVIAWMPLPEPYRAESEE